MAWNISWVYIILYRHQKRSLSGLILQKTQVAHSILQVYLKPVFLAPDIILHLYDCHLFIKCLYIVPLYVREESRALRFRKKKTIAVFVFG
jgi:hypothetical protein